MVVHLSRRQSSVAILLLAAFLAGSLTLAARRLDRREIVISAGGLEAGGADPDPDGASEVEGVAADDAHEATALVTVHVCGAVAAPGVYGLPAGARVTDAIAAAGGLTSQARPESINMAARLVDSTQVYVPAEEPSARGGSADRGDGTAPRDVSKGGGSAGAAININTADPSELELLPGIGPALAQRITDYRLARGRYERPEQLMDVPGIGPAKYAAIEGLVTVY